MEKPPEIQDFDTVDDEFTAAQVQTVCATGRSLRSNLPDLARLANETVQPSWVGIVEILAGYVGSLAAVKKSTDAVSCIDFVRDQVASLSRFYHRSGDKDVAEIIGEIATGIQPFRQGELRAHIEHIRDEAAECCGRCLQEWGGGRARERAGNVPLFDLQITVSKTSDGFTAFCDHPTRKVTLVTGIGDQALQDYLSLLFYFFHEQLSHVFPIWDDLQGKLSEAHLFGLEKRFLREHADLFPDPFYGLPFLIMRTMEEHQRKAVKSPLKPDYYAAVQDRDIWLESQFGSVLTLPRVWLELCATGPLYKYDLLDKLESEAKSLKGGRLQGLSFDRDGPLDVFYSALLAAVKN